MNLLKKVLVCVNSFLLFIGKVLSDFDLASKLVCADMGGRTTIGVSEICPSGLIALSRN